MRRFDGERENSMIDLTGIAIPVEGDQSMQA
jgi:hypothetical protein